MRRWGGWTALLLAGLCVVALTQPAGAGAFASKIQSAGTEDKKGLAAVRGRGVGAFNASDALAILKSEKYDLVAGLVTGLYLENQAWEGTQTVAVVRTFATRRGSFGKAMVMAAFSPHAEKIVQALTESKSSKDHAIAAAILSVYALSKTFDEVHGAPASQGGGGKTQVGGPIADLNVEALVEPLLSDSSRDTLEYALLAAAHARARGVSEAVEKIRASGASAVEAARLLYWARIGKELPEATVKAVLKANVPLDRRYVKLSPYLNYYDSRGNALMYVCQAIGAAGDERFVDNLHALMEHKDLRVQIDAIRGVEGVGSQKSVPVLLAKFKKDISWPVRIALLSALGGVPAKESVQPILTFLDNEDGRLRQDAVYALASIAGGLPEGNPYDWNGWWALHRETFQANPSATQMFRKRYHVKDMPVIPLADFYGIEIISSRMVFVLDTSASMKGEKIVKLKETMALTVEGLPLDLMFNVVDFGGMIRVMKPGSLIEAKHVSKASNIIQGFMTTLGTRTFDAMEVAANLPVMDTMVYLSDGAPVAGQFQNWARIIRTMDILNRYRPISIHTVHYSVGGGGRGSSGMQSLADRNVGSAAVSNEANARAQAVARAKLRSAAMLKSPVGPTGLAPGAMRNEPFSDTGVERAIKKGIEYLFSRQYKNGSWQPYRAGQDNSHDTGPTALAIYALLEAGISPQDSRIQRAIAWLEKTPADTTYALVTRCNAWLAVNRQTKHRYQGQLRDEARRLWEASYAGRHTYPATPGMAEKRWDNSNSQFGVLGVWAAMQSDIEVPMKYWEAVMSHWQSTQLPDGGWNYRGKSGSQAATGTMTAGGVASLFVCFDELNSQEFVGCGKKMNNKHILNGLAWFDKNFSRAVGDWTTSREGYYFLYGVERVGLAAGYKYFGTQDWYKIGATKLINAQQAEGSWLGMHDNPANEIADDGSDDPAAQKPVSRPLRVSDTCFALLFLLRGRHPVLFNKLEFTGDWNNRPRDMATLTRWISDTFEKKVNWQIVNLKVPVKELHDAPILYISGAEAPQFTDKELDKLREFVWQGGCLLSVTECKGEGFSKGIRGVYRKLFGQYELTPVGKDHPIYRAHFPLNGVPEISILSNGVRPLAIHTEVDLAKSWQLRNTVTERGAFQTAANIFMYVTDPKALRHRGTSHWPEPKGSSVQHRVTVARIEHVGSCDPEPLALKRFALLMKNEAATEVKILPPAPPSALAGSGAKVALMTGTNEFSFTAADKQAIKAFVEGGGTLIIDGAGGPRYKRDPALHLNRVVGFVPCAAGMLREVFGDGSLRRLSLSSPVMRLSGMEIKNVKYRRDTRKRLGYMKTHNIQVVLDGERPAVFFSAEDITGALVGYSSSAVDGYHPDSAFPLLRNMVLYGAVGKSASLKPLTTAKPPATTPPPAPAKPKPPRIKKPAGSSRRPSEKEKQEEKDKSTSGSGVTYPDKVDNF